MAPNSPKVFQTCLILIALVNLRAPRINGHSFNAFLGQGALTQQQITGVIRSKAEGPIQNQVYYNNADIVKSTYATNPVTTNNAAPNTIFQQPQNSIYQKHPYFGNVASFQPTPFHNHDGFKYNGVYYTSNGNNNANHLYTNNNNAILANQQITNAPIVSNFNNAVVSNQLYNSVDDNNQGIDGALFQNRNPNYNIQNFRNQDILQQLNNNNNAFNPQNSLPNNNQLLYNQIRNPFTQNSHFQHPAIAQNQIHNQGQVHNPGLSQNQILNQGQVQNQILNQGQVQNPGLSQNQILNQGQVQNPGLSQNQILNQGQVQNPGLSQNQILNQGQYQHPGIYQNQINNEGVIQNPGLFTNQGVVHNQGIIRNQINGHEAFNNQAKTQPILKYNIPSQYYQYNGLDNPQPNFGNHLFQQNSLRANPQPISPPTTQISPQTPDTNDLIFHRPPFESITNNSILQTDAPETTEKQFGVPGAILGLTRESPQRNKEPLQTLTSQEISDAQFYAIRERPQFPPLIDQGDIDNEDFRRRSHPAERNNNQRTPVRLVPLVQSPNVPTRCAYNSETAGAIGENCVEIK